MSTAASAALRAAVHDVMLTDLVAVDDMSNEYRGRCRDRT